MIMIYLQARAAHTPVNENWTVAVNGATNHPRILWIPGVIRWELMVPVASWLTLVGVDPFCASHVGGRVLPCESDQMLCSQPRPPRVG